MSNLKFVCSQGTCWPAETGCNMGEDDFTQCPHFEKNAENDFGSAAPKTANSRVSEDDHFLPWTGNSLGSVDLQFVAGRSRPWMIGIIGSQNSGKTTLLTAFYLLLSRGQRLPKHIFTNSYSLHGWENLASELRWKSNDGPTFPPHTSSNAGRKPGLMHLAFRRESEAPTDLIEDIILTDAPGEWFQRWAISASDPVAEGARYIVKHADAFLLLADSEALAGPDRGTARNDLYQLGQRLSDHLVGRPLAVVWSKADQEVPATMQDALRKQFASYFPNYSEWSISIYPTPEKSQPSEIDFVNVLNWALPPDDVTNAEDFFSLSVVPRSEESNLSPLLVFRGR